MRPVFQGQLRILEPMSNHRYNRILKEVSRILDKKTELAYQAWQDLTDGGTKSTSATGRPSLAANQVVRIAILMRYFDYSYREVEYSVRDSRAAAWFIRLGLGSTPPKKSSIQGDVKKLGPETWKMINDVVLKYAADKGIELGKKIRTDTTVVESNIHHPTDASLLDDCIRVITRLLDRALDLVPNLELAYQDHTRRSKRRILDIHNASGKKDAKRRRLWAYKNLLEIARWVFDYGHDAVTVLNDYEGFIDDQVSARVFAEDIDEVLSSMRIVIDQAHRRVLQGEKVPVDEKIVSIFEKHTDIIRKDNRETLFGHKICISTGSSNLVTELEIEKGNPADSSMVERTIKHHETLYGSVPKRVSFDGGFASQTNLDRAKELGVEVVVFHKKRGIAAEDMAPSHWIFTSMRRFRAGIEGIISALKRDFGLSRCPWRGERGFHSYVWSGVVAFNLVTIAKHLLKL